MFRVIEGGKNGPSEKARENLLAKILKDFPAFDPKFLPEDATEEDYLEILDEMEDECFEPLGCLHCVHFPDCAESYLKRHNVLEAQEDSQDGDTQGDSIDISQFKFRMILTVGCDSFLFGCEHDVSESDQRFIAEIGQRAGAPATEYNPILEAVREDVDIKDLTELSHDDLAHYFQVAVEREAAVDLQIIPCDIKVPVNL